MRVTAAGDEDAYNDTATLTHMANGGDYGGVMKEVKVTVVDDETASLLLSRTSLEPVENAAGTTYTVKLSHGPTETVTVTVSGHSGTDLTLSGLSASSTLTFTTSNWNEAQTVTVTAAHDADAVNDEETLTHTAEGGAYEGLTEDMAVTVDDDEETNILLSTTSLAPVEGNAAGTTYTVRLTSEPTSTVTVEIGGHSGTDLRLSTTTLTFTASNWNEAQTVTVTAGEDPDAADDTATLTHTASGGDYGGVTRNLPVRVEDDESPHLALSKESISPVEGARPARATRSGWEASRRRPPRSR